MRQASILTLLALAACGDPPLAVIQPGDAQPRRGGGPDDGFALDASAPRDGGVASAPDAQARPDAAPGLSDSGGAPPTLGCPAFRPPETMGQVAENDLEQASGLAASALNPGVLWTHNDHGDRPRLFALTTGGRSLGDYRLRGVSAEDWEDVAVAPGPTASEAYLYVADIGDNDREREQIAVYRVREPLVPLDQERDDYDLEGVEALPAHYPGHVAKDAEALLVDPQSGAVLVVTKEDSGVAEIYSYPLPLAPGLEVELVLVGSLSVGVPPLDAALVGVTGGSISADGSLVALRTPSDAWLWRRAPGTSVAGALAGEACVLPLAAEAQGEALSFSADGLGVYSLSEGEDPPLNYVPRL